MANISEHQYLQKTEMNAKVYKPRIKVSFHTEEKCYITQADERNKFKEKLDPQFQLLSVTTQKTLNSPAGAFTVNLAGTQWTSRLKTNDLVVIQMGYAGEKKLTTVMAGFIDNVRRSRTIGGDGKPKVSCTITGRDFGKPLLKSQLKFYPRIGLQEATKEEKFFLTDVGYITLLEFFNNGEIVTGTPEVILDNIMRNMLMKLNDVEWKAYDESGKEPKPKPVNLGHMLRYQLAQINFHLPFIMSADGYEGSIWNLMERTSIKPFTELWVDVRDSSEAWNPTPKGRAVPDIVGKSSSAEDYPSPTFEFGEDGAKVILCLRETPFESKHKDLLVRHEIDQADVRSEDLGKSDDEHYNLFWAGSVINSLGVNMKLVATPLFNEKDAKRYGLSPLEVDIEGLEILRDKETEHYTTMTEMTDAYSARLKAWFEKNHEHWNGSLTIRGNAGIRIGHMINYRSPDLEKEFYVEGVSHTFTVFEDWTTSLQITRGQPIDEKIDYTKHMKKRKDRKDVEKAENTSTVESKPKAEIIHHTVARGDTLWSIAEEYYKDPKQWTKIWEANKDMLIERDPRNATQQGRWIYAGQRLRIPK